MIDPSNIVPIESLTTQEVIFKKLSEIPICETPDYDLANPKEFKKYMTDIERTCRGSFEYRRMVNYLREYMNMNRCSFLDNVTNKGDFGIKIHLHHSPFTLYDIVNVVYLKKVAYNEPLDTEMVAKEVMYQHYRLAVGIIPLSETVHDLVHNGYVFIPVQNVMGFHQTFYEEYKEFIPIETRDLYEKILDYSEHFDSSKQNQILQKSYIYYNVEGQDNDIGKVVDMMNDRIDDIKRSKITYDEPKQINYLDELAKKDDNYIYPIEMVKREGNNDL